MLSAEEQTQADRYRFARDRETFIAAHALLRAMLSGVTNHPTSSWTYTRGEYGKPILAGPGAACGLHFNISHTAGMVACAVSRHELGVDVEASDQTIDLSLAERWFNPEEVALARSSAHLFFRFWTLKEAFIKATGEGLSRPLSSFSFRLDPPRVTFHPCGADSPYVGDPDEWQFAQYYPAPNRPLALAVRYPANQRLAVDMRAAHHDEVVPDGGHRLS